jgi:hypothetical protein
MRFEGADCAASQPDVIAEGHYKTPGAPGPAAGILFRNVIQHAKLAEHAIACGTGQQFARCRAGRFGTARWGVVVAFG